MIINNHLVFDMNFDIDTFHCLLDDDNLQIIKHHVLNSDIPLYLKHQNINNTIWITNVLMKKLYNITLSDFENYYPSSTFQDEIEGLRSDIHSPIYRNGNVFFFDCSKIKYTHFDYVIKILSYLIENTALDFDNIGKKKDIFDFMNDGKPKLNLLSKKGKVAKTHKGNNSGKEKNSGKGKKTVKGKNTLKEEELDKTCKHIGKDNIREKKYEMSKKCKQFWILNPNNAIEIFLKKIEVLIQSNCEYHNFIFVSNVNKIKYKSINKIITSSSIIPIKINTSKYKDLLFQKDNEIIHLLDNIIHNNNDKTQILQSIHNIVDYLLNWFNNDIILVKLCILLWLKKINSNNSDNSNNSNNCNNSDNSNNSNSKIDNKKLLLSNVEHYTYLYVINEIPLFKLSNNLFQKFSNAKTINPVIDYYQYSFSLLSIPNIINELVFYFNLIISKFLKYSEYDCIRNLNINQRIELTKLITNLQYECIYLDKPISQLQSFFVDCIKIIKKY